MSTSTRPITADELLAMPNNVRRELVRGEVREMAPAGSNHGDAAETGYRLSKNPDTVRAADVSFIAKARIPKDGMPLGFWPGAPDLAVETISPGDTLEEVEEKIEDYLAAKTRMVVLLTPRRKTVTVHRPGANPVVLREADVFDAGDVVPGFRCNVADIFA